jgi:hypothetical protein
VFRYATRREKHGTELSESRNSVSIEDDHEHLAQKMKEAILSAQATQPDVLVFCLRGAEIQKLLLEMAETCESEAEKQALPENVKPIRAQRVLLEMAGSMPTIPGTEDSQQMRAMAIMRAREMAEAYRSNAKTYRFLAAHVEEDRYFRLGVHDLNFLGLVPRGIASTSCFPIG